jgi:hypothetical protein
MQKEHQATKVELEAWDGVLLEGRIAAALVCGPRTTTVNNSNQQQQHSNSNQQQATPVYTPSSSS